ncbi:MAG: adenine phosphoribosyltransferase [Xanthomonadaceae bacterium]|jgi:adenine phosphoribosyltransferase|nr:adenine phosphoribosyltransferase [Xanthomonadaceae bacterium]
MSDWRALIREVPDFPSPGVLFKDITPVLADAEAFTAAVDAMAELWRGTVLDAVIGVESRGFILGAALARTLGTGFVPVRKVGKLPGRTLAQPYAFEYGQGQMEIHADALDPSARAIIVDDVLATGGTLVTALTLARRQGANVVGAAVLIELEAADGRGLWDEHSSLPLLAAACL